MIQETLFLSSRNFNSKSLIERPRWTKLISLRCYVQTPIHLTLNPSSTPRCKTNRVPAAAPWRWCEASQTGHHKNPQNWALPPVPVKTQICTTQRKAAIRYSMHTNYEGVCKNKGWTWWKSKISILNALKNYLCKALKRQISVACHREKLQ